MFWAIEAHRLPASPRHGVAGNTGVEAFRAFPLALEDRGVAPMDKKVHVVDAHEGGVADAGAPRGLWHIWQQSRGPGAGLPLDTPHRDQEQRGKHGQGKAHGRTIPPGPS